MKKNSIDWELVRSRLRSSERALDEAMTASPERIDAVYRSRAARLAQGRADQAPAAALTVMVFRIGLDRYAIEMKEVAEAVRLDHCTPVPSAAGSTGSAPLFAGVINLRGELVAVLDLARLLALPESGETGFVLLLRRRGYGIGLKVDRIEGLREIGREELSLTSQGKYVMGLTTSAVTAGALRVLSVDAVLAEVFSKERV